MRTRAATVAGVLGLATAVNASGKAIINNNCDYDVYLWPVSVDSSPSLPTIISGNGGHWSQPYQTCTTGGMSLKLASTNDISLGITQFEYTLEPGNIWYDISNVNCLPFGKGDCPFAAGGMTLESGSGCPVATCEGGNATCHDAYTYPDDNWASLSCEPSADTTLNLCGSSSGSSSSSSSGGIIGQLTSAVGSLLGGGSSSTEAPSTSTTPTTTAVPTTSTTPTPTPSPTTSSTTSSSSSSSSTTSSSEAAPTPAAPSYSHHQWSPPAAVSDQNGVAAAAIPTTSSAAEEEPSSSVVATTFATVAITTPAPENPNVAVVYETVTTMVSTTVVYQHKMFHKERRGNAHPHARRHQHEE